MLHLGIVKDLVLAMQNFHASKNKLGTIILAPKFSANHVLPFRLRKVSCINDHWMFLAGSYNFVKIHGEPKQIHKVLNTTNVPKDNVRCTGLHW